MENITENARGNGSVVRTANAENSRAKYSRADSPAFRSAERCSENYARQKSRADRYLRDTLEISRRRLYIC